MAGTVRTDAVFKVRCACGAPAALTVGTFGRPMRCASCSGSFKVVWGIDSRTKKKVPVTIDISGERRPVFKIPPGAQELVCPCGQHLLAKAHQVGKRVQCPVCRAWMKLERYKDPQTLETRIRRIDAKARPSEAAKAPVKKDVQDILCTCGESLRVAPEHLGKQAQCPACGAVMHLEGRRDPQTSVTTVAPRIVGQAGARGLDEQLSLDDFS